MNTASNYTANKTGLHTMYIQSDSKEIQIEYHMDEIKLLEERLNGLTLLENPREIRAICQKIISIKSLLKRLEE